eukprot:GHVU01194749.1.p1 GENE.GHVU01194749.1~~GHVU01194749.1.p1  ORF type:complete len:408 (-),score=72.36 GHVU01194749.1:76-1299(-)
MEINSDGVISDAQNARGAPTNPALLPAPIYAWPGQAYGFPHSQLQPLIFHPTVAQPDRNIIEATEFDMEDEGAAIPRCHLHTKPQLECKLCRKFKNSGSKVARMQMQREQALQPLGQEKKNIVELVKDKDSKFGLNTMLAQNILNSDYYKSLYRLTTFENVVDEIWTYAKHAEPNVAANNRAPSTLFCCLFKLFIMRLTETQVQTLLEHTDSPYIRCVGFLYLRYGAPPEKLWSWFEPWFLDDEQFASGADGKITTTVGEYAQNLISEDKYFNTVLPRIPLKIKSTCGANLMAMEQHRKHKRENKANLDRFEPGTPLLACSKGQWVNAEVRDIVEHVEGRLLCAVNLPDGTSEEIDFGLVRLIEHQEEPQEPQEARAESPEQEQHLDLPRASKRPRRHRWVSESVSQ